MNPFILLIIILIGSGDGATGVRGTYWATSSDAGGCSLPSTTYAITDALALGQGTALGDLAFRPGLCGKVLNVQCTGGQNVPAVVASTCNIGSTSCGVDLIAKTWAKATGNAQPGVSSCTVTLSSTNPISGGSATCYQRPNTAGSAYYQNLGLLNAGSEIVKSATLAGVAGAVTNGDWFGFDSGGQALFTSTAKVIFTYESGSSVSFQLSACKASSSVQIFQ